MTIPPEWLEPGGPLGPPKESGSRDIDPIRVSRGLWALAVVWAAACLALTAGVLWL